MPPTSAERKKRIRNLSLAVLIAGSTLSIMGGANQIIGYFSIGIPAVIVSLVSGLIIVIYLPKLIESNYKETIKIGGLSTPKAAAILGAIITLAGVGPYVGQFLVAKKCEENGRTAIIEGSGIKANFYWQKATKKYAQLGFDEKSREAKVFLAQSYYMLGDTKTAKSLLKEVDTLGEPTKELMVIALIVRSNIAKSQGDLTRAELDLEQAKELVLHGTLDEATIYLNYALLLEKKGPAYNIAVVTSIQKAQSIFADIHYDKGIIISQLNLASFFQYDSGKVRAYLDTASIYIRRGNFTDLESLLYSDYALLYKNDGDVIHAEKYYNLALQKSIATSDISGQASILIQLAFLAISKSDNAQALQYLKQSKAFTDLLSKSEDIVNNLELGKLYLAQAGIFDALNNVADAEAKYQSALKIFDDNTDVLGEIEARLSFAAFYQNHSQSVKAQTILDNIEGLLLKDFSQVRHQYVVILYNNLGKMYKDAGNLQKALEYTSKSLEMARAIGDKLLEAQAMENLSILNSINGTAGAISIDTAQKIFGQYHNGSEQSIASLNVYLQQAGTWTLKQVNDTTDRLIDKTDDPFVSPSVKNQLLLGIQVDDVSNKSVIKLRTKLMQLLPTLNKSIVVKDYGRCNLSLALIANRLGNVDDVRKYLIPADSASSSLPYPNSILYLKKIGLLKFQTNDYNGSVSQFFKCIDISIDKPLAMSLPEVKGDLRIIFTCWKKLDKDQQCVFRNKVKQLSINSPAPDLNQAFEQFLSDIKQ